MNRLLRIDDTANRRDRPPWAVYGLFLGVVLVVREHWQQYASPPSAVLAAAATTGLMRHVDEKSEATLAHFWESGVIGPRHTADLRVGRRCGFSIKPWHPDGCGGLKPLGDRHL